MLIKNKSQSLLAKIAFCVVSFYGIIAVCGRLGTYNLIPSSGYISPITYGISFIGNIMNHFVSSIIDNFNGAVYFVLDYISEVFFNIWYTINFIIYGIFYAMLAQKIFFGDAFKKEYYKPKNFFNIYIKILIALYLLSPAARMLVRFIWNNQPALREIIRSVWRKRYISVEEIYAMLTVFLVYKAIGLARKKSQAAPLQTTDHLRQPEMQA